MTQIYFLAMTIGFPLLVIVLAIISGAPLPWRRRRAARLEADALAGARSRTACQRHRSDARRAEPLPAPARRPRALARGGDRTRLGEPASRLRAARSRGRAPLSSRSRRTRGGGRGRPQAPLAIGSRRCERHTDPDARRSQLRLARVSARAARRPAALARADRHRADEPELPCELRRAPTAQDARSW